jgi:MFS transporter, MHS family, shikimate and dehydroshikimate transport protein
VPVLDGHDRVAEVDVGAIQVVQHHLARRTARGGDGPHHRAEGAQHLGGVLERLVRQIAGGAIGTLMEYYDYYLYGLASAAVFPAVFFAGDDPVVAQLSSFATFAVGFFLRPIGGLVFGAIGDRMGRKVTLMITVVGMGIATACIGLIPPVQSIGIAAPLLLLFFRMLQGFFVGGEMGGAATMVVEHAPTGRHGLYGAFLISGAGLANVASAGLMAALGLGSQSWFMTWGWRIPFLIALVLAIVAIILRRQLEESEEFTTTRAMQVEAGGKKATATIRPDVEGAARLHELAATTAPVH